MRNSTNDRGQEFSRDFVELRQSLQTGIKNDTFEYNVTPITNRTTAVAFFHHLHFTNFRSTLLRAPVGKHRRHIRYPHGFCHAFGVRFNQSASTMPQELLLSSPYPY
jgi:hypothetical protein